MDYLVNKTLLDLYDKYDGDLGLLDERWASGKDREAVTMEQTTTLGESIDKLSYLKADHLSADLRARVKGRIKELESRIEPGVVRILKDRILTGG